MHVEYVKCLAFGDRILLIAYQSHVVTRFLNFASNHIFGIGEAKNFKFRMLIHT